MTRVITNGRIRDESELPDVPPGGEYERVIASQKFIVLHRIHVRDMILVRLQIGTVEVPFELEIADSPQRMYKPKGLDDAALKKRLIATGAAVATNSSIAIAPGLEVRALLRNAGETPIKPHAALFVQEESA